MDRVSPVTPVQKGKDKVFINYNFINGQGQSCKIRKRKKGKDFIIYKFINL